MKKFYLAGVLGVLLCAFQLATVADEKSDVKKAPAKVPLVTRDNFVSLQLFRRADSKSEGYWLRFDNSGLRIKFRQTPINAFDGGGLHPFANQWSEPASMSRNQVEAFLEVLNAVQLPKLAGYYSRGKSSVMGFVEVLVLTISDDKNHDQEFEIQNYSDSPPRGYAKIIAYLRSLQVQKFSDKDLQVPEADWVTQDNFSSLTLETSGGFAGIRSLLQVVPAPGFSSIDGSKLKWSQTIGGRTETQEAGLSFEIPKELIRLVNSTNFSKLNGKKFQQPNLADGFNEVLTLTLNDGRTFTVSNYGDTAPPEYYALTQYLNELKNQKFNKSAAIQ